jgi:pseudouridine-5'-phosphate glycosidase
VAAFQAEEFPAFFTPHSGCAAPCRVDTPQEAAKMIKASQQLDLGAGLLFGKILFIRLFSGFPPLKLI